MAYLVQLTQPHQVELRDYPTPEPGPGEVRVRTLYSGISAGTELATYRGTNPYLQKQWDPEVGLFLPGQATFTYPVDVWGYSEVGVVEAVGSGDRPVLPSTTWCGASGATGRMPCCRPTGWPVISCRRGSTRSWARSTASGPWRSTPCWPREPASGRVWRSSVSG